MSKTKTKKNLQNSQGWEQHAWEQNLYVQLTFFKKMESIRRWNNIFKTQKENGCQVPDVEKYLFF